MFAVEGERIVEKRGSAVYKRPVGQRAQPGRVSVRGRAYRGSIGRDAMTQEESGVWW